MPDGLGVVAHYVTRDIGYGEETGKVILPASGPYDWVRKRPYPSPDGVVLWLFDDEIWIGTR